jgi:hypothetical protein
MFKHVTKVPSSGQLFPHQFNASIRNKRMVNPMVMMNRQYGVWDTIDNHILDKEIENTRCGENVSTIREFPVWNEVLACDSEAALKADRSPSKTFTIMQQETIDIIRIKQIKGQYPHAQSSEVFANMGNF